MRTWSPLAAAALVVATLVAPMTSADAASATWAVAGPRLATVRAITALGDSVPAGTACDCRAYPLRTASWLAALDGPTVSAYDDAVGGMTTSSVLTQLSSDVTVRSHVRRSQLVVVEVGANDVSFSSRCSTTVSCYATAERQVSANLTAIVAQVRRITAGRPVAVVLLGYWNVWLDGKYAAARGSAYVAASRSVTAAINTIVQHVAETTSSGYADLWTAFRGADDSDDTALLASDGDHPNAAGHRVIASALFSTVTRVLGRVPYPRLRLANLYRGAVNADVVTYQEAVREHLAAVGRLGRLDPAGITGRYDAATRAMTAAAYRYQAQLTHDSSWLLGRLDIPGAGLLPVLGLRQR